MRLSAFARMASLRRDCGPSRALEGLCFFILALRRGGAEVLFIVLDEERIGCSRYLLEIVTIREGVPMKLRRNRDCLSCLVRLPPR